MKKLIKIDYDKDEDDDDDDDVVVDVDDYLEHDDEDHDAFCPFPQVLTNNTIKTFRLRPSGLRLKYLGS